MFNSILTFLIEEFMSQGQVARSIEINIFSLIPTLVQAAEALFGRGTGAQKKAAVTGFLFNALTVAGSAAATQNPRFADAISTGIDAAAGALFPHDDTGAPAQTPPPPFPAPVPALPATPASPVNDPTLARYKTLDEATAATTADFPLVLMYPDPPKYGVWPATAPPPSNTAIVYTRSANP